MKTGVLFSCLVWLVGTAVATGADSPAQTVELKGIMASDNPRALLEVKNSAADKTEQKRKLLLAKGQKDGEIVVVDIDPAEGKVTILNASRTVELRLQPTQSQISASQQTVPIPQLKGIVGVGSMLFALIDATPRPISTKPNPLLATRNALVLQKGQRDGRIEVLEIDGPAGRVKINVDAREMELAFATDSNPGNLVTPSGNSSTGDQTEGVSFLRLQGLETEDLLRLYQLLVHRTLLRPMVLPSGPGMDLYTKEPVATSDVARTIEQLFVENGIVLQADGEKFTVARTGQISPEELASRLSEARDLAATIEQSRLASRNVQAAGKSSGVSDPEDILPAGVIYFSSVDVNEVLKIYRELTDRTIIQSLVLPAQTISLRNNNPLTREEAIYSFNVVFALNDISILAASDKFLLVGPIFQKYRMAGLLLQKSPIDTSSMTNAVAADNVNFRFWGRDKVARLYSELSGRNVELGSEVPSLGFTFKLQSPLSAGETLHALDLLLGLHGLKVQENGSDLELVAAAKENSR